MWRRNSEMMVRFDKNKLKDVEVRQRYQEKIAEHLTITENPTSVENAWMLLRNAVLESANEELVCDAKRRSKPWFDEQCRESVEIRSAKRIKWLQQLSEEARVAYYEARRNTDQLMRKKKRDHHKSLLIAVEEAKSSRSFFQASRFARGAYRQRTLVLTNETGEVVPPEEQATLFKKHFENLLNPDNPPVGTTQTDARFDRVEVPEPSEEEISVALKALKNNKAPGGSGITAEMLRLGGETLYSDCSQPSNVFESRSSSAVGADLFEKQRSVLTHFYVYGDIAYALVV
ncbi:uncharacterized protein LOC124722692 [Schistocerca piceifrons]|uniref:uncharacterized protein LOC124722692 n=1 Tax=Schistocerca piceifrons TaxID=274613 RepID=UPI001F5F3154|nr:uncharacterized protein LOC124722692 [Schistocerca piceifrons]